MDSIGRFVYTENIVLFPTSQLMKIGVIIGLLYRSSQNVLIIIIIIACFD